MQPAFRIPVEHAQLTDEREIVKVIIDVSEPVALFNSTLVQMAVETGGAAIDDQSAQYIANNLLASAVSPHGFGSASQQLTAFFHSSQHERVKEVLDQVKTVINHDLAQAERQTEQQLGQKIYPCSDINGIAYRGGNLAVLRYRVGPDPMDNLVDDPYAELSPVDRLELEEEEQNLMEDSISIEGFDNPDID